MSQTPPSPFSRKRWARPWHRVLGLFAALPLIWVVLTGAVLEHTVDWKLDRIRIDQPWLLRIYGMEPKGQAMGMRAGKHLVAEWDGLIFVDGREVDVPGRLVGALNDKGGVDVVTDSSILRMDAGGAVLEKMDELSLPELPLTGVFQTKGVMAVRNAQGWHRAGMDWLNFETLNGTFQPQVLRRLTAREKMPLRRSWSQGGLPLSRVLLDAHSGRFLGPLGKYVYDLLALATLSLSVTGLILFFRKPRRAR